MASRIFNILAKARDTLADQSAERWSDDRLLRLVDEAQKDVAKHSRILRGTYIIPLAVDTALYSLPEDIWIITRATYNGQRLRLVPYDKMDELAERQAINNSDASTRQPAGSDFGLDLEATWEDDTGSEVTTVVYDMRNLSQIRVYPIPDDSLVTSDYTFTNDDGPLEYVGDQVFGVVVGIDDYTLDTVYGCVTSLYDPEITTEVFDDLYGVVTGINEAAGHINLYYIKIPATIETMDDELELPSMFDIAIKHYIVGHAFLDDIDTRYQAKGTEALGFYSRELSVVQTTAASNGVKSPAARITTYRGAF